MFYKEAICSSRWITETIEEEEIQAKEAHIAVTNGASMGKSDLLNRCLVGRFQSPLQESPPLTDVRRWACNSWKSTIGVNVCHE